MNLSGEHAHLGRGRSLRRNDYAAAIDPGGLKFIEQNTARLVFADNRDKGDFGAQSCKIRGAIGSAARHCFRMLVTQNEDGRFARDAADLAIDKPVGNRVADHEQALLRKGADYLRESVHAVTSARQRDIIAVARAKTSSGLIAVMQR